MGQDKAQLIYRDDQPEWIRLHSLLNEHCDKSFLSHPADQESGVDAIIDPAEGPLCAIHAAQQAHPHPRWLVIACDLPLLESSTIAELIASASAQNQATS